MKLTLDYVVKLAKTAGDVIRKAATDKHSCDTKLSRSDLVTETDVAVEKLLINQVKHDFPDHRFFCEETTHNEMTDEPTWVIDPVDGTTNFFHTFPLHACSIAYCEKKQSLLAVVYIPHTDELFAAEKGNGATLNGEIIKVAPARSLGEALVSTGFSVGFIHSKQNDPNNVAMVREVIINNFVKLLDNVRDIRRTGACSIDMCYVACGRQDGFAEFSPHEWDVAAGGLIVEEAGGFLMSYGGQKFSMFDRHIVAASSRILATDISNLLTRCPLAITEF